MRVEKIPIDKIIIPEQRARATFDEEKLAELRASIEKHGFTVPILVRELPDGKYELIDGEHRLKIVKELGWKEIPATILKVDDAKATLLNVLANTARGTQNPMDVAEALKKARDVGLTEEELAAATGHDIKWVRLYLTLNELPDEYKEALRSGKLKVGHIKEAMRLQTPQEIAAALDSTLVHDWSVSVLKYYVDRRLEEIREAYEKGEPDKIAEPPKPEEAQQMVTYGDCMICRKKWPRKELMMPVICPDCRALLEYIIDQLGDPKKAINIVYEALKEYFEKRQAANQSQMQTTFMSNSTNQYNMQQGMQTQQIVSNTSSPITQNTQQQTYPQMAGLNQMSITEDDLKLLQKIKKLREVGLL